MDIEIKQLLEEELDIGELSLRKLQDALEAGGYTLSYSLISRMGYATQVLLPLIPQALNAGLGRPQVQRIRALDRAAVRCVVAALARLALEVRNNRRRALCIPPREPYTWWVQARAIRDCLLSGRWRQ